MFVKTCIDWTSFNFNFNFNFINLMLKIIIYCVNGQPSNASITWSWRSVLIYSSQFWLFCSQWATWWVLSKNCIKRKSLNPDLMSKVLTCLNIMFAVKMPGISCLALIFNLSNLRIKILHSEIWLKVVKYMTSHTLFFSVDLYCG